MNAVLILKRDGNGCGLVCGWFPTARPGRKIRSARLAAGETATIFSSIETAREYLALVGIPERHRGKYEILPIY